MLTDLPRWTVRLNASRQQSGYQDLMSVVNTHFRTYASAEQFLGPYNARQRQKNSYTAPDRETLKQMVKQGGMNDLTYFAFISSLIRFCEQSKGQFALPSPHPSAIHSIQLAEGAFDISPVEGGCEVTVPGCAPLFVSGLRAPDTIKFIIVRPKLSTLGTASSTEWEVLFFTQNFGYVPQWTDSQLNPRYSGLF